MLLEEPVPIDGAFHCLAEVFVIADGDERGVNVAVTHLLNTERDQLQYWQPSMIGDDEV